METALLISNLAARTVSEQLKQVIVKALSADLKLEVADTEGRNHATDLARDAADRGFDLVISLGGDGTMNEVANGLVATETAMALLPGGMANVMCRALGISPDIVEATGRLLNRVQGGRVRRINVGKMDGRYFVMSCGAGLDAETVKRVESNPAAKWKYREWFFLSSALRAELGEYRKKKPNISLTVGEVSEDVVTAIVTNIPEISYWRRWPITIAPKARLERGLDVLAAKRLPVRYIPGLMWSTFGAASHVKWKHLVYVNDVATAGLSCDDGTFPTQVDGEFAGDRRKVDVELIRDGLVILD